MLVKPCDDSPRPSPRAGRYASLAAFAVIGLAGVLLLALGRPALAAGPISPLWLGLGLLLPLAGLFLGRRDLVDGAPRDPDTGLAGPAELERRLHDEIARARRTDAALALVVLELDGPAPAARLRAAALSLALSCRRSDLPARLGPGELALLAPGAGAAAAALVAQRAQETLARMNERSPRHRSGTMSVGIADLQRSPGATAGELLAAARAALRHARAAGGAGGLALAPRQREQGW